MGSEAAEQDLKCFSSSKLSIFIFIQARKDINFVCFRYERSSVTKMVFVLPRRKAKLRQANASGFIDFSQRCANLLSTREMAKRKSWWSKESDMLGVLEKNIPEYKVNLVFAIIVRNCYYYTIDATHT